MPFEPEPEPFEALLALARTGWTPIWSAPPVVDRAYGPDAPGGRIRLSRGRAGRPELLVPEDPRVPARARTAALTGHRNGWSVRLTFVAGDLLLRAYREPFRLAASWIDGAFEGGWLLVEGSGAPPARLLLVQLRAFLDSSASTAA